MGLIRSTWCPVRDTICEASTCVDHVWAVWNRGASSYCHLQLEPDSADRRAALADALRAAPIGSASYDLLRNHPELNSADGQGPAAARKGDDPHRSASPGAVAGHCIPPQVDSDGPAFSSVRHPSCADFYTCDIETREDVA